LNLSEPYEEWWCCLNPRESTALSMLVVSYFANPSYITRTAYTVIAFVSGLAALSLLNAYFIPHYGLTEGIILDSEGEPIEVLLFDGEFWALFYIFSQSGEFACPEPCANFAYWT